MKLTARTIPRLDLIVVLIALLAAPLFLAGLGNTYLWQDEAQTALLGRSVLTHGVPMVGEGANSLSAVMGTDAGVRGIYFQVSWLQAYLVAASFSVFGESTWAARIPFAFAGWLCVPLVAWVMRQAGTGRASARLAALLIALNVPFIVSARQARYYALTSALVLVVTGTYAGLASSTAARFVCFTAAASLLVMSFDVTAIGVLGALAFHWLIAGPGDHDRFDRRFWVAWGVAFLVLIAWLALSFTAPSRQSHAGFGVLINRFRYGSTYYIGQINAHVLPLPLLLTLGALWLRGRTPDDRERFAPRRAAMLFSIVVMGGIGGAMLSPYRFFRYAVPVLPIVLALGAIGLAALSTRGRVSRLLAAGIVVALVTSTAPFVWSHNLMSAMARASGLINVRDRVREYRVPLAELAQELRDPPRGPIAATVEYLRRHGRPNDVVVTSYGELPLKFHTRLTVYGGETAQLPPVDVAADWIWPRHLGRYREVRASEDWIDKELSQGNYAAIELPVVDRRWENREDPEEHIFFNPGPSGPPVVLYRAVE
jgi:4-amino-4-deoxy-L-arabinose transferase-like glycosyltransferase